MIYKGWVPTITGQLSFMNIGGTYFPSKCCVSVDKSFCVVTQKRDLLDVLYLLPHSSPFANFLREKTSNYLFGITGKFEFTIVAINKASDDSLTGVLGFTPYKFASKELKTLRKLVQESENAEKCHSESLKLLRETAFEQAEFSLKRNGELKITTDLTQDGSEQQKEIDFSLANQFFFFLKDVVHVHQHHDPKYDNITNVSVVNDENENVWVLRTQSSLYRAIIRLKRFRSEYSLFQASGLLAYATAFEKTQEEQSHKIRNYHREEIRESLSVARSEVEFKSAKKFRVAETLKGTVLGFTGLILSATFLLRFSDPPIKFEVHSILVFLSQKSAENTISVLSVVTLIAIALAYFQNARDPAEFSFFKFVLRLMQPLRLRWFILFNIFLSLLSGWIFYLLIFRWLL